MIRMSLSTAAESLHANFLGQDVEFAGCSTDSRTLKGGELFIALKGEQFDGHDFIPAAREAGARAAMVEKTGQADLPLLVVNDTRQAMGSLAGLWRARFRIPLVAITGSNGKTTVKEMLVSILRLEAPVLATRGNLNNNIGVPLTLFGMGHDHRFAVVEMGANHPGEIGWLSRMARPTVALITQCAPAHLEGFGSVDGVARAKSEIYEGLDREGIAIINADDPYAGFWRQKITGFHQLSFGLEHPADVHAPDITLSGTSGASAFAIHTPIGKIDVSLSLPGRHNVSNALAAAACAIGLRIDPGQIKRGLEHMSPIRGRLELRPGMNNSRLIDDTYNANPASLRVALDVLAGFQGRRWLVLGDMGELGAEAAGLHARAGEMAKASGVERLYAIGPLCAAAVKSFGTGAHHFTEADSLAARLVSDIEPGVTVLIKGSRAMRMEKLAAVLEAKTPAC